MRTRRTWGRLVAALAVALVAAVGFVPRAAQATEGNVAKIGDTEYATLNDAIAHVGEGETIELIDNVSNATGISVSADKNFTIDFGGHTYTLTGPGAGSVGTETQAFQLLKGSTVTFMNGTVNIAPNAKNIMRLVNSYGTVTFEDMTFDATNQVGGEDYTLSFNNGNATFKGDTNIITSGSDVIAFDVCLGWSDAYKTVSVTFDETYTGQVEGTIVYDSPSTDAVLTVNGNGTFDGIKTSSSSTETPAIKVSGGTFSSDVSEFLVAGMVQNENGTVVQPDVAEVGGKGYKSLADAVAAAQPGQTVTLLANASTDPLTIDKGITLDLGDHTLSLTGTGNKDEVGLFLTSGSSTIKNGTIYDGRGAVRTFSIIVGGRDTALTTQDLTLTVLVPEDSADNYPLRAQNGAALTLNSGTTINEDNDNGTRRGYTYGVTVYGNSTEHAVDPATATTLVVNDGVTVSSGAFAVSGNAGGSYENTVMTINGGTLESTMGAAIYHPHYGRLVVNGGVIQGLAGIEMRAGELEIAGGLIKGGDGEFTYVPNGGGSTSDNVALAVMQHSTKLPIKIDISGGTFEATEAFAQMNVQENDQEAVRRIDLSIAGGEFKGGIYSENFKDEDGRGFVSGGSFDDLAVGDFLAPGAAVAVNDGETPYDIYPSKEAALENGGAHAVVDKQGNTWVFADKDAASSFAGENGSTVETVKHTVTFDDRLPTTTNQVVEVENGSPVTKPTDPVCEGWKFLGWYEFANGSYAVEPYDFAAPVRSNLTLYAKWEQIEEEPEVTPQNPSESEKGDGGLAQTSDPTTVAPLVVSAVAGIAALAAGAVMLRRRK